MRIAIYARVSTVEQSVDFQLADLRRFAQSRGFEIVAEFVDVGISGTKSRRPQLDLLIDQAKKQKFDGVLVWKFDRWARSVKHLVDTMMEFHSRGIKFLSYSENFDTSTPMGQAMFAIIGAMAQLERDLNSERTTAALANAKANGVVLGQRPLGKTAEVLRLRSERLSVRKIASLLKVSVGYVHGVVKAAEATSLVA